MKFPPFMAWRFITICTIVCLCTPSWASWIQSTLWHPKSQYGDCSLQETLLQNLATAVPKLHCSLRRELQKVPIIPCETLTEERQIACLDMLIGRLLDQADVATASRLETMFNHHNQVTCWTLYIVWGVFNVHNTSGFGPTCYLRYLIVSILTDYWFCFWY
jgi:hypothetical protein